MDSERRFNMIGTIEKLFLEEAYDIYKSKNYVAKNPLLDVEKPGDWVKSCITNTRLYLNYLDDDQLESILKRKISEMNDQEDIQGLLDSL